MADKVVKSKVESQSVLENFDTKQDIGGGRMKKIMESKLSKQTQETLIGEQTSIVGNIKSDKSLRIEGSIEGDIVAQAQVIIGKNGHIKGNIVAESITVYGRVDGDINAQVVLEIMPSGKVKGDVKINKLCIHEGAIFIGTSYMEEADKVTNK